MDPQERRGLARSPSTRATPWSALPELDGQVDLVISNPPYIPLTEWEYVAPEARDHDPEMALFSGEDGLDTIRGIERTAHRLLRPGGIVVVEHADTQGGQVPWIFGRRPAGRTPPTIPT